MPNFFGSKTLVGYGGYNSVQYDELSEGSPMYAFANGASRCERTYLCRWEDRDAFVKLLVGFSRISNVQGGVAPFDTYVLRKIPDGCPDITSPSTETTRTWLWCTQVSQVRGVEPLGYNDPITQVPVYQYALVTAVYEGLTYKVVHDADMPLNVPDGADPIDKPYEWYCNRYVTRVIRPHVEYIALARGKFSWVPVAGEAGSGGPVDYASSVLQSSKEIVYTWHQVPFVPEAARTYIGTVNRYTFYDSTESYDPGTLMYTHCEIKPYRAASGGFVHDIQYRLKHFEPQPGIGHNYFLRFIPPDKLRYQKMTHNGNEDLVPRSGSAASDGIPVFRYSDFKDLFSFKANSTGIKPDYTNIAPPGP